MPHRQEHGDTAAAADGCKRPSAHRQAAKVLAILIQHGRRQHVGLRKHLHQGASEALQGCAYWVGTESCLGQWTLLDAVAVPRSDPLLAVLDAQDLRAQMRRACIRLCLLPGQQNRLGARRTCRAVPTVVHLLSVWSAWWRASGGGQGVRVWGAVQAAACNLHACNSTPAARAMHVWRVRPLHRCPEPTSASGVRSSQAPPPLCQHSASSSCCLRQAHPLRVGQQRAQVALGQELLDAIKVGHGACRGGVGAQGHARSWVARAGTGPPAPRMGLRTDSRAVVLCVPMSTRAGCAHVGSEGIRAQEPGGGRARHATSAHARHAVGSPSRAAALSSM